MEQIIKLEGINKSFGSVTALENICFELHPNEVLGLVGDNGAGKTTLIKILSGVIKADSGSFYIGKERINLKKYSVARARKYGIETVHQDRALGEKQPIWRNFFMGRHMKGFLGMIRINKEKEETIKILKDILGLYGAGVSPDAPVCNLSGGERQGLAIGRAIYFNSDIVILDEPCTALAVNEVNKVLSFIRQIKKNNKAAILISHNLSHVYDVSDRFVFLNQGKIAGSYLKSEIDLKSLTGILMNLAN